MGNRASFLKLLKIFVLVVLLSALFIVILDEGGFLKSSNVYRTTFVGNTEGTSGSTRTPDASDNPRKTLPRSETPFLKTPMTTPSEIPSLETPTTTPRGAPSLETPTIVPPGTPSLERPAIAPSETLSQGKPMTTRSETQSLDRPTTAPYKTPSLETPTTTLSEKPSESSSEKTQVTQIKDQHYIPPAKPFSKPFCSNNLFQKYYLANASFPENGLWLNDSKRNKTQYQLDFCEFRSFNFEQCVKQQNWSTILVLGDSNGARYFKSLKQMFNLSHISCKILSTGVNVLYHPTNYHGNQKTLPRAIQLHKKECRTCISELAICEKVIDGNVLFQMHIEYISFGRLIDPSVRVPLNAFNISTAEHQLEYLFKIFYGSRFPDAVFFFLPFTHEKKRLTPTSLQSEMESILKLIRTFMPERSSFYWIPCFAENEVRRLHSMGRGQLYGGLWPTDMVYSLNIATFHALRSVLSLPDTNHYGFINLVNMSLPVLDWNLDGVHYEAQWYSHVWNGIFSTLCNSVQM